MNDINGKEITYDDFSEEHLISLKSKLNPLKLKLDDNPSEELIEEYNLYVDEYNFCLEGCKVRTYFENQENNRGRERILGFLVIFCLIIYSGWVLY